MAEAEVKLIKWGLIFFNSDATIKYSSAWLQVSDRLGAEQFSCKADELKKVNFNSINGMFTLKSYAGRKCNIVFLNDSDVNAFREYLKSIRVGGLTV